MRNCKTPIIPASQEFHGSKSKFDYPAICAFAALGFFLDRDTFWTDWKTLPISSECTFDETGALIGAKPYFRWEYKPRDITFDRAVEEFGDLLEQVVSEQVNGRTAILPLSGGLDSRTLAAALKRSGVRVSAFSYAFDGGHDETFYSKRIAEFLEFPFRSWQVGPGYLWDVIDELALINQCYSEFTHPRQMALHNHFVEMGDVFSLGHWGDVLFNDMGVAGDLPSQTQVDVLLKKIVKKGGMELGTALWNAWGLAGEFREYLVERIEKLHRSIDIPDNANARIRAFKSMYWAPRWTSVNLAVFESVRKISLPYYDDRMCKFITTVPERYLAKRKIQIEYLKRRAPDLARVAWQAHRPFNLFNYQWDKAPWNLPARAAEKFRRWFSSSQYIQRNWELQFLGEENLKQLRARLFDEPKLSEWIPLGVIKDQYDKFVHGDPVKYSHPVSMLLTLSLFRKHFCHDTGRQDHKQYSAGSYAKSFSLTTC